MATHGLEPGDNHEKPRVAVGLAALLNFVGAFISLKVAATIAEDIVDPEASRPRSSSPGCSGGIFWNLLTWRLSIPSSSSHAFIGGVVGAVARIGGSRTRRRPPSRARPRARARPWSLRDRRCERSFGGSVATAVAERPFPNTVRRGRRSCPTGEARGRVGDARRCDGHTTCVGTRCREMA